MKSILIFTMFGILLLLPGVGSAETYAECKAACAADKVSRDEICPPLGEGADQERVECLQENLSSYNICVNSCPLPEPADTQADAPADKPVNKPADKPAD
jgi:hypothetical protein